MIPTPEPVAAQGDEVTKFMPADADPEAYFRARAKGHAPGYDIAVYARPAEWLAVADTIASLREQVEEADRALFRLNSGEELQSIMKAHNAALARVEALEGALEPFAELADEGNEDQPDETKVVVQAGRSTCYGLTLKELRAARAVLAGADGGRK